ncbi:hypothetical protein KAS14_03840 [Candidatus Bathyarchaeota archaeon]|nr:hypothetical protein [Candidatus Bathyarchaeota archaeon]
MAWTRLGLALYIFAIINFFGFFYSLLQEYFINVAISLATYLILLITSANIEES